MNYKMSLNFRIFLLGTMFIILHTGIWIMPNIGAEYTISQLIHNPKQLMVNFSNPMSQYILAQFLEPFLFSILNLHKQVYFIGFLLLENLFLYFLFTVWFLKYHDIENENIYKYFLALCFPVFSIPFYWTGMNGAVLLLLLLSMIFYDSYMFYIFAFLLSFQSSSIGINSFFIFGISLIFYKQFADKFGYKLDYFKTTHIIRPFIAIFIILVGKFLLLFIFSNIGIHRTANAFTWIKVYWKEFVIQWFLGWNAIVYSIYGILWVGILNRIKMIWYLIPPTFMSFTLTIIANDETRIALMVLFPSLFYFILKNKAFFNSFSKKEAYIYIFVFFISPFLYVWGGIPYAISLIPSDINIAHMLGNLKYYNWNTPWILHPH
ncbi:hypothetical protein [Hydrogenobaculum acidophilum]